MAERLVLHAQAFVGIERGEVVEVDLVAFAIFKQLAQNEAVDLGALAALGCNRAHDTARQGLAFSV